MSAAVKKTDSKSLRSDITHIKKSLLNLNFQKSTGQLEKTSEIKKTRRKIASFKTIINTQKENKNA